MVYNDNVTKDLVFRMRLDAKDRERLDQLADHYSAPAATVVRILIKEKVDALPSRGWKDRPGLPGLPVRRLTLSDGSVVTLGLMPHFNNTLGYSGKTVSHGGSLYYYEDWQGEPISESEWADAPVLDPAKLAKLPMIQAAETRIKEAHKMAGTKPKK